MIKISLFRRKAVSEFKLEVLISNLKSVEEDINFERSDNPVFEKSETTGHKSSILASDEEDGEVLITQNRGNQ